MPSLPTCIGHEVGSEKAELFILRCVAGLFFDKKRGFSDRSTELPWKSESNYTQCYTITSTSSLIQKKEDINGGGCRTTVT